MESEIAACLSTLGHPQRLAVFRLLMRRYPDRVPAGEIAAALDLKPSTLSAYLAALMRAGLVMQERAGTSLHYAIAMEGVRRSLGHLLADCCRGRPDLCAPEAAWSGPGPAATKRDRQRVLFVCTGNSARSILAEAILRREAGDRFLAFSAGTAPYPGPNPVALDLLAEEGHDVAALRSKHVDEFRGADAPRFDFVFTVCDRAANEDSPAWPGQPVCAHWGVPDPVKTDGNAAENMLAFRSAHDTLKARIRAFTSLPLATLDPPGLQRAVDDIARSRTGTQA